MTDTATPGLGLVMDCADPERLAAFWAPALGYAYLGMAGSYAVLVPDGRPGPKLLLQRVPEPKTTKNRMHLDIQTPDIDAEASRFEALGAARLKEEHIHEHRTTWLLMTDPEGNEFCVCDNGAGGDAAQGSSS
jgi:predicted enzyme related to lactoylglutathione lyase